MRVHVRCTGEAPPHRSYVVFREVTRSMHKLVRIHNRGTPQCPSVMTRAPGARRRAGLAAGARAPWSPQGWRCRWRERPRARFAEPDQGLNAVHELDVEFRHVADAQRRVTVKALGGARPMGLTERCDGASASGSDTVICPRRCVLDQALSALSPPLTICVRAALNVFQRASRRCASRTSLKRSLMPAISGLTCVGPGVAES